MMERTNKEIKRKEIKRRSKVVGAFPNKNRHTVILIVITFKINSKYP